MRFTAALSLIALCLVAAGSTTAQPGTPASPPGNLPGPTAFTAKDRPGDSGKAVLLTWKDPAGLPPGVSFEVRRAQPPADEWTTLATVPAGAERYVDATAKDNTVYRYELRAAAKGDLGCHAADTAAASGATTAARRRRRRRSTVPRS